MRSYGLSPKRTGGLARTGREPVFLALPLHNLSMQWGELSARREEGSHQRPPVLASWSQTCRPPELWEINICCVNHPVSGILLGWLEQIKAVMKKRSGFRNAQGNTEVWPQIDPFLEHVFPISLFGVCSPCLRHPGSGTVTPHWVLWACQPWHDALSCAILHSFFQTS